MIIGYVSVFFMFVGILMYALCVNPKLQEIGKMLFFSGALAFAMGAGHFGYAIGKG